MASHSRFTDEIYCTPAPSAPQISVRTINDLRGEIFRSEQEKQFQGCLHTAEEMKSKDLYEKYSPSFRDKNKQFIFKYINDIKNYSPASDRSLLITRWKPFLPEKLPENLTPRSTSIKFQADVFSYESCGDNQTVEWYLNFANHDLFAYYSGPLLAQDELQVLECVELAALREYFVQTINTVGSSTVGSDKSTHKTVPTPILISNTERVVKMDTNKVYGNAFAKASERQLIQACEYLSKPQTVNLIAIEAPSHGRGVYTREQIEYILVTCYVGFKAAQVLATKTKALNTHNRRDSSRGGNFRTIIHTGWWGCGAYGNNRQMMILTQILAAYWTQIDELIFHTQTNDHKKDIDAARAFAEKMLQEKRIDDIIQKIGELNLEWDRSNNT